MLLKYLNDLDNAVQEARRRPGPEQIGRCMECAQVLSGYLDGQVEPLRRRGLELMEEMLPSQLQDALRAGGQRAFPPALSELTRAV
jgi:hypothetical protein